MSVKWEVDRSLVDQEFAADIDCVLGASEYAWAIVQGFRTAAQQEAIEKTGVQAAAVGHSAHEYGLAVDVAILVSGKETWAYGSAAWPWLWAACFGHPRLHSGHFFPPAAPADEDHIQAVKWYVKRAELKAEGKW